MTLYSYLTICFFYCFFLINILPASPPCTESQCCHHCPVQDQRTISVRRHLWRSPCPTSCAKQSYVQYQSRLLGAFSRQNVWKSPATETAPPLCSLLLCLTMLLLQETFFLSVPRELLLLKLVTVVFCLHAAKWGRPRLLSNYPVKSWRLQLDSLLTVFSPS